MNFLLRKLGCVWGATTLSLTTFSIKGSYVRLSITIFYHFELRTLKVWLCLGATTLSIMTFSVKGSYVILIITILYHFELRTL
jgi:hypothetical protein